MGQLYGRAAELEALDACSRKTADEGHVSVALVEGEPGSGKTRLLREAVAGARIEKRVELACYQPEQDVAFGVGWTIMRAIAALSSPARDCLGPSMATPAGRAADSTRLFEAVHRAVSLTAPLLLAVDDIQWCDAESAALLHYLVRGADAGGEPLTVVVASRPAPGVAALKRSLRSLLDDRFEHIILEPLEDDAAVAVVQSQNPDLDHAAALSVARRSRGSPFWCQLLATASDAEADASKFVAQRLQGASTDAAAALATAALLARPFTDTELTEIHSWPPRRALQAVEELVDSGLVVTDGASRRVAHDVIRAAATDAMTDTDTANAHERIASWLEERAGEDVALLLLAAQHRAAAGRVHAQTLVRVVQAPLRRALGSEGLDDLIRLAEQVPPHDPRAVVLEQGIAELADELGRHAVALERWQRVAQRVQGEVARARAWLRACDAAQHLERVDDARASLERARRAASHDPLLELELEVREAAMLRWLDHRLDESTALTQRALERARHLAAQSLLEPLDPRVRKVYLRSLVLACVDAMQRGSPEAIVPIADEMAEVAAGSDIEAFVEAGLRSGSVLLLMGRLAEAERRLSDTWNVARRSFLVDAALDVGSWLVWARYLMGILTEAEEVAQECRALSARVGEETRPATIARRWNIVMRISRGDGNDAFDELRAMARDETDVHHRIATHQLIATWLARLQTERSADEVIAMLEAGRRDAAAAGCDRCRTELLLTGVESLARVGAVDVARSWLEDGQQSTGGDALQSWLRQRAAASIAVATADDAAADLLRDAVATADELRLQLESTWVRLDLGRVLGATDAPGAAAVLEQARTSGQKMGAITEVRLADQLLRQAGVRTWRPSGARGQAGGLSQLTPREQEIATLIAGGASNREIAQNLFLSRKTIERHASNIFSKVGVSNRAQLAARVAVANRDP